MPLEPSDISAVLRAGAINPGACWLVVGYGALRLESASITHHGSGRVSLDLKVSGYPMSAEEGELLLAMLREEQKIKPGAVVTPDRRPGRRRMNLGGTGA